MGEQAYNLYHVKSLMSLDFTQSHRSLCSSSSTIVVAIVITIVVIVTPRRSSWIDYHHRH